MASAIEKATATIDERIRELKAELTQLETARKALTASNGSSPGRRRRSRSAKPSAKRSRSRSRVDRAAQLKEIVAAKPSLTPAEVAREMGVSSAQAHGVIKRLTDRGEISRSTKGFSVKS